MKLLDELNAEQRRAVETTEGPVAIIAGPGTGKTKTLTTRIAYLIEKCGVQPGEVLALTFTNKAASEMGARTHNLVSTDVHPHITTFHALCFELLQQNQSRPFRIISEPDRLQLLRTLKKDHEFKGVSLGEVARKVSYAKSTVDSTKTIDAPTKKLLVAYNAALRNQDSYDFDDLLQQAYVKITSDEVFRERIQARFRHILVDEFQDTNDLQYALLKSINTTDNIFIIGDPLQSIYAFRGASAEAFNRFKADWPSHKEIILRTNYRSVPKVVATANAIFPEAHALRAQKNEAGTVRSVEVLDEYAEASFIIGEIEKRIGGTSFERSHQADHGIQANSTFKDYAILYRTHRIAVALQRSFSECGIPFQIVGDGSPYEQRHIQTTLRIMRYVSQRTEENRLAALGLLKGVSAAQLDTLLNMMSPSDKPAQLAEQIAKTFSLVDETSEKTQSFSQFVSSLVRFGDATLADCLEHLDDLAAQNFYDPRADAVTLLTIHAAKGLEFDYVFLIGVEDGMIPHKRQQPQRSDELAEEKRLFYVAATRAQTHLDFLHARSRSGQNAIISPFLASIADKVERHIDPALEAQLRQRQKRQQKRAQTSLF